ASSGRRHQFPPRRTSDVRVAPVGDHHTGGGATGAVEAQRARERSCGLAVRPGAAAEAVRRRAGLVVAVGPARAAGPWVVGVMTEDRKSTRLNSSHSQISY